MKKILCHLNEEITRQYSGITKTLQTFSTTSFSQLRALSLILNQDFIVLKVNKVKKLIKAILYLTVLTREFRETVDMDDVYTVINLLINKFMRQINTSKSIRKN